MKTKFEPVTDPVKLEVKEFTDFYDFLRNNLTVDPKLRGVRKHMDPNSMIRGFLERLHRNFAHADLSDRAKVAAILLYVADRLKQDLPNPLAELAG